MDLGLRGKVAVVTGGSEGIGEGISIELAREGATVAVLARREEPLRALAKKLSEFQLPHLTLSADITIPEQIDAAIVEINAKLGAIDILVNNAGGGAYGTRTIADGDAEWQKTFELNVFSCVRMTRAVFNQMKSRNKGCIITIASVGGHSGGMLGVADYNAAKAAQLLLTKSWAHDFAPFGIRVNAVNPAFIRTPLWEKLAKSYVPEHGATTEEVFAKFATSLPIRRMGTIADVGRVVAFLASDIAGGFITGACWDVDGGFTTKI
jgi:3-oxoacyl-[acyl-carrier protein] reductase